MAEFVCNMPKLTDYRVLKEGDCLLFTGLVNKKNPYFTYLNFVVLCTFC